MGALDFKSGGDKLEAKLRELATKVGKIGATKVQVGFFEGATYPDGTSVPMVAAINNYGAPAANVPPRPFFTNMIEAKHTGWPASFERLLVLHNYDVGKALALLGVGIEGQLRQSIIDLVDPPLSPVTIKRKGFDKPLVESGVMLNSISSEVK